MTMSMEERLASLEASYAGISRRLDSIDQRLTAELGQLRSEMHDQLGQLRSEMHDQLGQLRSEMGQLRAELGHLRSEVRTQLYFILTFMAATFGGLFTAILATR